MPVQGIPDPAKHKLCLRCGQWHEPEDGKMLYPEASGPLRGLRRNVSRLAGDQTVMRFMCQHCIRVRLYTRIVLWCLLFLVAWLAVLLANQTGPGI